MRRPERSAARTPPPAGDAPAGEDPAAAFDVTLSHRFADGPLLDIHFRAPAGVTALFGQSGAGKSSVLRAVAGLFRPDRAHVAVAGRVLTDTATGLFLPPHRRRLGCVFQQARLLPHLSVLGNLRYGARRAASPPAEGPIIRMLGLEGLLSRRPAGLSGGEAQRVAIGRALLAGPVALLMDEPLASLDEARKEEIMPHLEALRDHARLPVLLVSHDMDEVARLADTLVLVRQGRVMRAGPVSELLADPDLAPLIGVRNAGAVLRGRLEAHHPDGLSEIGLAAGRLLVPQVAAPPGSWLRVRIPADDVIVALSPPRDLSALNDLACVIEHVHHGHGPGAMLRLACGPDRLLARVTRRSVARLGLAPGRTVHALVKTVSVSRQSVGLGGAGGAPALPDRHGHGGTEEA